MINLCCFVYATDLTIRLACSTLGIPQVHGLMSRFWPFLGSPWILCLDGPSSALFFIVFCDCRRTEEVPGSRRRRPKPSLVAAVLREKKVLIIVVVLGWCVYRITLICFRSLSLISPLRGTYIAWFLPREGYILRYFHKGVILLDSFYKRRYYSWSFGRRYIAWFLLQEEVLFLVFRKKFIAWFLQQEVPPLLVTSTGGDYIACSLLQEEAQLPADLSVAERCLGLVISSAGSLSCPLFPCLTCLFFSVLQPLTIDFQTQVT